jgi:hypothetical protein
MEQTIDLRNCKKGDILISKHGTKLRYLKALPENSYYSHEVEYLVKGLGNGTRNHDGSVFRKNKRPEDEDIVKILHI